MPAELVGKAWKTTAGKPICFGYNMTSGCGQAEAGGQCPKGLHVCAVPGCFGAHSAHQHR